jgi:hypothetical protein
MRPIVNLLFALFFVLIGPGIGRWLPNPIRTRPIARR